MWWCVEWDISFGMDGVHPIMGDNSLGIWALDHIRPGGWSGRVSPVNR